MYVRRRDTMLAGARQNQLAFLAMPLSRMLASVSFEDHELRAASELQRLVAAVRRLEVTAPPSSAACDCVLLKRARIKRTRVF